MSVAAQAWYRLAVDDWNDTASRRLKVELLLVHASVGQQLAVAKSFLTKIHMVFCQAAETVQLGCGSQISPQGKSA